MEMWLTRSSWVKSDSLLTVDDFKRKNGYWDWRKLDAQKVLNIMILSERNSGKTFGCLSYYLMIENGTVAFVVNTDAMAQEQSVKVLDSLAGRDASEEERATWTDEDKRIHEYFENWTIQGYYAFDEEGKKRIYFAGVNTYYKVKGAKSFLPTVIIYDEFNQNIKMVEQKGARAKEKLDTITGTLRTKNWQPRHLFWFANKNIPATPIQSCTALIDLGISSLTVLNDVTYVYNTIPNVDEFKDMPEYQTLKEYKQLNTLLLNGYTTTETKYKALLDMVKHEDKHRWDLDLVVTGNAGSNLFNEDNFNFDDFIINTFRLNIEPHVKHYGYIACENGDILDVGTWDAYKGTGYSKTFKWHIKRVEGEVDPKDCYVFKKPYKEGNKLMSPDDKIDMINSIYYAIMSYEDTVSRVDFFKELL